MTGIRWGNVEGGCRIETENHMDPEARVAGRNGPSSSSSLLNKKYI